MDVRTLYGPPGTGKSKSLIDFAEKESAKRGVMMLSYTKAAATELASRVGDGKPRASTIHSLAFAQLGLNRAGVVDEAKLEAFAAATGIPFKKGFDDEEQDGDRYRGALSYAKANLIESIEAYDQLGRPGTMSEFKNFCTQYEQWKRTYGYMDFDDMLIAATKLDFTPPPVVMLDEAQDCSPLQWQVFEKYISTADRVYIAGDDDQSIFEWNGADPHGMIKFSERNNASVRVLEQSYRVPKAVHVYVHDNILAEIKSRVSKTFAFSDRSGSIDGWSDLLDLDFHKVTNKQGTNLILVRDSFRMREIQKALHADLIPYTMAGSRISPYESGLANAIRGHKREGGPTENEKGSMLKFARDKSHSVEDLLKRNWRNAFSIPEYLLEFYDSVDLFAPINTKISTIHQAKGTEADNVIVDLTITQRVAEGIFSNRDAELRVWYVALTRTKDSLHVCGGNELL